MQAFVNALQQASALSSLSQFMTSGAMGAPSLGQSPLSGAVEPFPLNELHRQCRREAAYIGSI